MPEPVGSFVEPLIRLLGYGLFAAGLLLFLWVVVDYFAERFFDKDI